MCWQCLGCAQQKSLLFSLVLFCFLQEHRVLVGGAGDYNTRIPGFLLLVLLPLTLSIDFENLLTFGCFRQQIIFKGGRLSVFDLPCREQDGGNVVFM